MNVWYYLNLLMACTPYGIWYENNLGKSRNKICREDIILYNATPCYLRLTDINAYNYASCT